MLALNQNGMRCIIRQSYKLIFIIGMCFDDAELAHWCPVLRLHDPHHFVLLERELEDHPVSQRKQCHQLSTRIRILENECQPQPLFYMGRHAPCGPSPGSRLPPSDQRSLLSACKSLDLNVIGEAHSMMTVRRSSCACHSCGVLGLVLVLEGHRRLKTIRDEASR